MCGVRKLSPPHLFSKPPGLIYVFHSPSSLHPLSRNSMTITIAPIGEEGRERALWNERQMEGRFKKKKPGAECSLSTAWEM